LVITELDVGGAERCLVNLAQLLDRARFEVAVFVLARRPPAGADRLAVELEESAIPLHFLGARSVWGLITTLQRLRRLLRAWNPEIVQTFLFHANVVGSLAARLAPVPHLVTNVRVADPARVRWTVERVATRRADRIVCVSQSVARFCHEQAGFARAKLCVISNGLDPSSFPSPTPAKLSQWGLLEGERVLLCIGRLHPQKGFDWLLENCTALLESWPQHHLLIVGEGPERERLQAQARALTVARRVHFLGWRGDVPDLLAASDLFLLPSRWEGMPNALLEAMASRLPVVATEVEGVRELLGPLSTNQVVPLGEGAAFVNAISKILAEPTLARLLGEQNRARVEEGFSLPQMVRQYELLYDSLVRDASEADEDS